MSSTRRSFLFGVAALGAAPAARAQTGNWPTRPLRIIIPTAPGGSPDMVSRTLGNKLTERFGQPVVVESITQGVGIVGNQMVSKSAPDGHTFVPAISHVPSWEPPLMKPRHWSASACLTTHTSLRGDVTNSFHERVAQKLAQTLL